MTSSKIKILRIMDKEKIRFRLMILLVFSSISMNSLKSQYSNNSINSCNLKISYNKFSLINEEDLIYDSGNLNEKKWSGKSSDLFSIDKDTNLFYFYAVDPKNKDIDLVSLNIFNLIYKLIK